LEASRNQSPAAQVSTGTVKLLHEYTGRGPTKARTQIHDDSVVILLADTLTKGERALVEKGQAEQVLDTRKTYQHVMREDLSALVEKATGRKVVAFMSDNHIDPDVAAEIFLLAPADE
jgi:uncharacterized protein YbcI